jgi:hypothetical protein
VIRSLCRVFIGMVGLDVLVWIRTLTDVG